MPVFLIATKNPDNDEKLADRIKQEFPSDHYEVGRGLWFVSFPGVARDLYLKLVPEYSSDKWEQTGITSTMIIALGGYWGLMSRDMWDWIATKLQSGNG
jgi:hypothetical protein